MRRLSSPWRLAAILLCAGAAVLGATAPATAQLADTVWPMLQGGPLHTGRSPLLGPNFQSGAPAPGNVAVWNGFDKVKSSPTIAPDGTIYVGVGWSVCAINPEIVNGVMQDRWLLNPPPNQTRCRRLVADASPSSAAIGNVSPDEKQWTLYIGDRGNTLNAFDQDGNITWQYRCGSEGDVKSSPVIGPDGTVYVAFLQNLHGAGVVTAIDPNDPPPPFPGGSCHHKWSYTAGNFISTSSPALDNGVIYIGDMAGWFHSVDANTGAFRWKLKIGSQINGSPVIRVLADTSRRIYVGSTDGLSAVKVIPATPQNPESHSVVWTFPTDGLVDQTPALAADGTVYAGSKAAKRKTVYAIAGPPQALTDPPEGTQKWVFGPVLTDADNGPFTIVSYEGTVYTAIGKTLYALRPVDGTVLWSYSVPMNIISFPAIGGNATPETGGTSTLYVPSYDGNVYALSSVRGPRIPANTNSAPTVQASASLSAAVPGQYIMFSSTAVDADNDPLTFTWDFGDGHTFLGPSVTYAYSAPGTFDAKLTVSDGASPDVEVPMSIVVGPSSGPFHLEDFFNSTTLQPPWAGPGAVGGGQLVISGNELKNTQGAYPHIALLPSFKGPTQAVVADFASVNNQPLPRFGIILRYQESTGDYYLAYRKPGNTSVLRISKVVGGGTTETILAQLGVPNAPINTFFRLSASASGTTLKLALNGAKLSVEDTTFSTGSVGIMLDPGSSASLQYRANYVKADVE
jgi:outer membrane protein assembly factor BamB